MVARACGTCEGHGEVTATGEPYPEFGDEGSPCPDCGGDGYVDVPTRLDRYVGHRLADSLRIRLYRIKHRAEWTQRLWRDRNADTIGAIIHAHRHVVDDSPRLHAMIDSDLRHQLEDATPLYWRLADLRHAWVNARRAVRGLSPLETPYEEEVSLRISTEDADLFERNVLAIIGERRRKPRA